MDGYVWMVDVSLSCGIRCLSVRLTFLRVLRPFAGPNPSRNPFRPPATPSRSRSKCILRCTSRATASFAVAIKHLYGCRDIGDKISLLIKQIRVEKNNKRRQVTHGWKAQIAFGFAAKPSCGIFQDYCQSIG